MDRFSFQFWGPRPRCGRHIAEVGGSLPFGIHCLFGVKASAPPGGSAVIMIDTPSPNSFNEFDTIVAAFDTFAAYRSGAYLAGQSEGWDG